MADDARRGLVETIARAERLLKLTMDLAVTAALRGHLDELRAELAMLDRHDERDS